MAEKKVEVMLFSGIDWARYMDSEELLKLEVRYVGTDYELSGYDIYEHVFTGELYATRL